MADDEAAKVRKRRIAVARSAQVAGMLLVIAMAWVHSFASPALAWGVYGVGAALLLWAAARLGKGDLQLPEEAFGARLAVRRAAIVTASLLLALAGAFFIARSHLAAIPLVLALSIVVTVLRPYHLWASGWTADLDEYHLQRRHRARNWAYSFLIPAGGALAALAYVLGFSASPEDLRAAAVIALVLFMFTPTSVLAWTEPDHD